MEGAGAAGWKVGDVGAEGARNLEPMVRRGKECGGNLDPNVEGGWNARGKLGGRCRRG